MRTSTAARGKRCSAILVEMPEQPPPTGRRQRTGRNVQLNIRATAATVARFTALADKHGVIFGELLERALVSFVREAKRW